MTKYKIFLASSEELRKDRDELDLFINRKNNDLFDKGGRLDVIRWESFLDAMSTTRLQDEYNTAIRECDIFILLFFTKVGEYTLEEFQTAFKQFKESGKPLIYTYFKDAAILTGDINDEIIGMLQFRKTLSEMGHFYTRYVNSEHLQLHFAEQLDMLSKKGVLKLDRHIEKDSQNTIDFEVIKLVDDQLSIKHSPKPDEKELKEKIRFASDSVKEYIFKKTRDTRSDNWQFNTELMERTIPIFYSLIAAQTGKPYHYLYGQLGFALKDKENPDWTEAEKKLSTAIELRGDYMNNGWALYEFARAICRIMKDKNFLNDMESTGEIKKQILSDLKAANKGYVDVTAMSEQEKNINLKKWMSRNKIKFQ